jgi:type IV secretory pathway protease TraF
MQPSLSGIPENIARLIRSILRKGIGPDNVSSGIALTSDLNNVKEQLGLVTGSTVVGTTANPSTTEVIGYYTLPDPRITLPLKVGQMVLVSYTLNAYIDTADNYIFSRVVYSTNGGTSWPGLGSYSAVIPQSAADAVTLSGTIVFTAVEEADHIFGIAMGNASGGNKTITALSTYRHLTAVVLPVN